MGLALYALTERYQILQNLLVDGEVDEQTLKDTMASVEGDITQKVDNCAAVMRSLELEADAYRIEEVRLAERRKVLEANRDRLKRYVQFELESVGIDKCKGARFYVTIQNNPWKVNISDEAAVPADYWREVLERSLDKKAVLEALKAGDSVPGATMTQERSLRVK